LRARPNTIATRLDPADQSETDPGIFHRSDLVSPRLWSAHAFGSAPRRQKAVRHVMPQRDRGLARHGNNGDPPDLAALITNPFTKTTA